MKGKKAKKLFEIIALSPALKIICPILLILLLFPAAARSAADLREAILNGDIAEVNRLIQEGADVNLPDVIIGVGP
ncbi:MAG: hypothetical protein V1789_00615 [PVC group bacterium]